MTNNTYNTYNLIVLIKYRGFLTTTMMLFAWVAALAQPASDLQLAEQYLLKGDKKKALELFRDLAKNDVNNPTVYNHYINTLVDLGGFDEAQGYLKKKIKREPDNLQYRLDLGLVMVRAGEMAAADKYFKDLIVENRANVQRIKMMSDFFMARSLADYGVQALLQSREYLGNPFLFCLDLAMLYRIKGNQDKMVEEYLTYVTQNSGNIQYVKNVLQALLVKADELESLEKLLYVKVQSAPDVEVYADLLIWVTMQQKNFYASFVQARAYDKRYKTNGEKSMEIARVAMDNEDYETALKIYRYVIREFPNSPNQLMARLGLIKSREAKIKSVFPVKTDSVRLLVEDYRAFITRYPENINALEATRSEALLFAQYLDQMDSAVYILNKLIANPRSSLFLKSKAKLDLGDIYLLKGEPWESSLLYSQVEKMQKENQTGYEAKLKNAKLSYYKGNFKLAQEHLDILKEATTREIANDALDLSLRIKENIAFDTLGEALKEYAAIELLLYQNKYTTALDRLEKLKQGITSTGNAVNNYTILDDVYWLEANLQMQQGDFQKSLALLKKIQTEYPDDILADDAYFLEGEIYERQLSNKDKAMEIYRDFLSKYPGSVFAAEARKRYRILRGDFSGQETPQF